WERYEAVPESEGSNPQTMQPPNKVKGPLGDAIRQGLPQELLDRTTDATLSATASGSIRPGKQRPLAPSQLNEVLAFQGILETAIGIFPRVKDHTACMGRCYYLDVQSSLREELAAAYDFLSENENHCLWDAFCTPILVDAVRTRDTMTLRKLSLDFWNLTELRRPSSGKDPDACLKLEARVKKDPKAPPKLEARGITRALAWAIIVDAALLNVRFMEDMKAAHAAKGCPCAPEGWAPLFLPHPPPETCKLFNDYVRCRWPLHVFALDPETEDQNIGDSFSLRRELQLALSVAFTSGQISARNFTRYVRRIERDIDTIAINRTIIAFSHGDNPFGWRFSPRVQTPPIDGNVQAIFRDLFLGGYRPGHDLRRRRLENGIRECVALVIMPSFVPYVDLEITGNWFRLADPKCKELDLRDAMRLSRRVKRIQDRAPLVHDQDRYRAGDVNLMVRRLEQLSERLPLQSQLVQVPYENTHGGFELLSTGVTDLAPELIGWCGAPGINPNGDTALFLVGDNFSVHQTRVIVGGQMLDPSCKVECSTAGRDPVECKCPPSTTDAGGAAPRQGGDNKAASIRPENGEDDLTVTTNTRRAGGETEAPASHSVIEASEGVAQAGYRCPS